MSPRLFGGVSRLTFATCALAALAHAQGRIIAIGDEWLLSDIAFTNQPAQSTQLAQNIANYFANGQPGNFLVLSWIPDYAPWGARGVQGASLAAAMTAAGHTWTIDANAPITLANLSQYDGVFLCGPTGSGSGNAGVLASYVNGGGSVLVMAGTGYGGSSGEAASWDPLLNQFGLGFGNSYFIYGSTLYQIPVAPSGHALAQGLSTIGWGNGQIVYDLQPANPQNQIAVRGDFTGFGTGPQGVINDIIATFNLGAVSAVYAPFGSGCAGSAGVPSNTATSLPQIGQTMVVSIGNLPPPNVAFLMLGLSRTTSAFGPLPVSLTAFGAPGCFGRVSTDSVQLLLGSAGAATFSLAIPPSQTWLGMQLFTQALVLDPGWNALGAVTSVAAEASIGQ